MSSAVFEQLAIAATGGFGPTNFGVIAGLDSAEDGCQLYPDATVLRSSAAPEDADWSWSSVTGTFSFNLCLIRLNPLRLLALVSSLAV